jgi:hypothetical protein
MGMAEQTISRSDVNTAWEKVRRSAEKFEWPFVVAKAVGYSLIIGGACALTSVIGLAPVVGLSSAGGLAAVEVESVIKHKLAERKFCIISAKYNTQNK